MMNMAYLWVAIGGAIGCISRYWLSGLIASHFSEDFPWGTLVCNITGSFLIGILAAFTVPDSRLDSQSRVFITQFLMIGFCGGYTTFSSFSLQTLNLLHDREWFYASINMIFSVLLCMVVVWLGYLFGSIFNR
jgi:CrcB protein